MNHGFLKVTSVSPQIRVADCEYNTAQIAETMKSAEASGAKLIVFPELCITSSTCGDLFLQNALITAAKLSLIALAKQSGEAICIVGVPLMHRGALYNCAAVLQKGKILGVVPKTEGDRIFAHFDGEDTQISIDGAFVPFGASLVFACESMAELTFAIHIGDIAKCKESRAALTVSLCAEGTHVGREQYRRLMAKSFSAANACAYICADAGEGESTTDDVFPSHNIIAQNGAISAESRFDTAPLTAVIDLQKCKYECLGTLISFDLDMTQTALTAPLRKLPFIPENEADRLARCTEIFNIQARGLKKRIEHTNAKKLVIGISGGLDSTLALLVASRAMALASRDSADIITVTMPCFGTTSRTKNNAVTLCEQLGTELRIVDIARSVQLHFEDIGHDINDHSVTFENAQARERTQVLMDIANSCGGLVVGTGDLSELALGWATYNGDHMSMYAVNANVPKTLVRHLVDYCAKQTDNLTLRAALCDVLDTPVSPELLPAKDGKISQKTEDIVGPYELHDFFLYYCVRYGFEPKKVFRLAMHAFSDEYSPEFILKWLKTFYMRFFSQQFKRSCMPDGPRVGTVCLSPRGAWQMPGDACSAIWLKQLDEIQPKHEEKL